MPGRGKLLEQDLQEVRVFQVMWNCDRKRLHKISKRCESSRWCGTVIVSVYTSPSLFPLLCPPNAECGPVTEVGSYVPEEGKVKSRKSLGNIRERKAIPESWTLYNKGLYSQSYGFSSSHVWVWELDHKESWAPKNWCSWMVMWEKTPESPLNSKKIKPVNPKGNQFWIFIGRTDAEAEAPILWPSDAKTWLLEKDPDDGKGWGREEKQMAEDEAWCAACSPWGLLERVGNDWATELNWTERWTSGIFHVRLFS